MRIPDLAWAGLRLRPKGFVLALTKVPETRFYTGFICGSYRGLGFGSP